MTHHIRFGIIGGGLMGREFAVALARWRQLLDVKIKPTLVAVCTRTQSNLDWFTSNFETISQASTDFHDLLNNENVDAVYCAVPHYLHSQFYVDIIQSGKHLLGEKPFGIDLHANHTILKTAEKHPHLQIACSSEFPFYPGAQRIVRSLNQGEFGNILEVECGFLHSSDLDRNKTINWKRIGALNGTYGCMGDLGMHVFHIPLRTGWTFRNVRAILSNIVHERKDASGQMVPCDTWDNATMLCEVETQNSAFPLIAKTQRIAPGEMNSWYLTVKGESFCARFSTKRPRTLEFLRYEMGGPQTWQTEDLGYESAYKTITGKIFEFGFSDAFLQMCASFCQQIIKGGTDGLPFACATPLETRRCHEILSAAQESHRTRQLIDLV